MQARRRAQLTGTNRPKACSRERERRLAGKQAVWCRPAFRGSRGNWTGPAATAGRAHPFPSRTRKLSAPAADVAERQGRHAAGQVHNACAGMLFFFFDYIGKAMLFAWLLMRLAINDIGQNISDQSAYIRWKRLTNQQWEYETCQQGNDGMIAKNF